MIKKCLIIKKNNMYLSSVTSEAHQEGERHIELSLPLPDYWKLCEYIKELSYLRASGEPLGDVTEVIQKVFALSRKFAAREKDRIWLSGKVKKH